VAKKFCKYRAYLTLIDILCKFFDEHQMYSKKLIRLLKKLKKAPNEINKITNEIQETCFIRFSLVSITPLPIIPLNAGV